MSRFLIGIDDTDNLESQGTGHRARQLARALEEAGLLAVDGITRHQLLVDSRIPYTSHNSAACLLADTTAEHLDDLKRFCGDFLQRESAPGSDAGLCLVAWEQVTDEVMRFGARAKVEVLTQTDASRLADGSGAHLEGLTGTGGGVIGALAAVGLRVAGNDGRFLWLRGLRELSGVYSAGQLCDTVKIDSVETETGLQIASGARVYIGDWVRPVLRGGRAVLIVEEANHVEHDWHVAPKERIKQLTG